MLEKFDFANLDSLTDEELRHISGGDCSASIKARRQLMGWTQEQLAEKVFVDVHTVRNWEKGRTDIKGADLFCLSLLFDTSLDDLWDAGNKYPAKNR